jgi:hypothetical protein
MVKKMKGVRRRKASNGLGDESKRRLVSRLRRIFESAGKPTERDGFSCPNGSEKGCGSLSDLAGPEGPMPSEDAQVPLACEISGPGFIADAGGHILTINDDGHGPLLDVVSSSGRVLASGEALKLGEETEIPLRGYGESIFVTAHRPSVHGATYDVPVQMSPSEPRVQLPRRIEKVVTIARGDEADIWGYRFFYRPDMGSSSRMQVINGATGIPVDDFTPKSGRTHMVEDERSGKKITIVPKAVYTQSIEATITVEKAEGPGSR